MIAKRFASAFKAGGVAGVMSAVARRIRMPHARSRDKCRELVKNGTGLEIGGPSSIFAWGGLLPVYPVAQRIDNINFASRTIWEDGTKAGDAFQFHAGKAPGQRSIGEGTDLREIPSGKYDFVLSSHMLEHTANPLRALTEWKRVLRPDGTLVLVIPARDGAFDHRRPITTMAHLAADFAANRGEDDLTHLAEVLELHDLAKDPGAGDAQAFRERAERNGEFRSLHHHVFDTRLIVDVMWHTGFEVIAVEPMEPYHIVVVARNPLPGIDAKAFDEMALREVLRKSPFPSDRQGA